MNPHINLHMPDERREGQYADFVSVWHTADSFVFDFAAITAAPHAAPETAGEPVAAEVLADVVARIRMPAGQIWEIMKALEAQYTAWEHETGRRGSSPQS